MRSAFFLRKSNRQWPAHGAGPVQRHGLRPTGGKQPLAPDTGDRNLIGLIAAQHMQGRAILILADIKADMAPARPLKYQYSPQT